MASNESNPDTAAGPAHAFTTLRRPLITAFARSIAPQLDAYLTQTGVLPK
jgi:hypothetical protein